MLPVTQALPRNLGDDYFLISSSSIFDFFGLCSPDVHSLQYNLDTDNLDNPRLPSGSAWRSDGGRRLS